MLLAVTFNAPMKWRQALKNSLNLFLASTCPLCGRSATQDFCQDCQQQIQRCQVANPTQFWQQQSPIFSWGLYEGRLKRAITALKYENQPQLARPLGQWLAQAWLAAGQTKGTVPRPSASKLMVVPIPLHQIRQQQRGYNQAALLAHEFCSFTGLPLRCHGLSRTRQTQAQFSLSITDREQNLAQAFCLGSDFLQAHPTCPVLLLDDIYTTGATGRAATQALQQSGIKVYGLITVALTRIESVQKPITK